MEDIVKMDVIDTVNSGMQTVKEGSAIFLKSQIVNIFRLCQPYRLLH